VSGDFRLKPLPMDAVARALEKVKQYRLLNEPREAESICLDVLAADPGNQEATAQLILSLTDQFTAGGFAPAEQRALELLPGLDDEYRREYYRGLIAERRAKAQLQLGVMGDIVYHSLREAMEHFERAEKLAPDGRVDAVLRWNACARVIMSHRELEPRDDEGFEPYFD
jgi:hypothetical protein